MKHKQKRNLIVHKNQDRETSNHLQPVFTFTHFDSGAECPSSWTKDEVKQLFSSLQKISRMTWSQIQFSGGSNKSGVAFTVFKKDPFMRPDGIRDDIAISEIRISEKARLFGARVDREYIIIRLDRNHSVCPM